MGSILGHEMFFFINLRTMCEIQHNIPHMKIVFRRLDNDEINLAGGRPKAAVEYAVARCQL